MYNEYLSILLLGQKESCCSFVLYSAVSRSQPHSHTMFHAFWLSQRGLVHRTEQAMQHLTHIIVGHTSLLKTNSYYMSYVAKPLPS